jgi:broad-specificity NMP kinase
MGTPGVPFNIPKSRILETIKKKKGVVTQICLELDIAYDTYAKHIKSDPELKSAIDVARNDYDETICDLAETALMRALNQEQDLSASLSSAKFVLNNKGKKRGYSPIPVVADNKEAELAGIVNGLKELLEKRRGESVSGSKVEAKQPLSDSK